MNYWLIKSEPDCYSIDDLKRDKKTSWTGIRNYQARNFMRDSMKKGDLVLFHHSGANPPQIVGIAQVASEAKPDTTAMDPKDDHFDPQSSEENPLWFCVDMKFVKKLNQPVTLPQVKFDPQLSGIMVAARGSRLSIQPVSEKHFNRIVALSEK